MKGSKLLRWSAILVGCWIGGQAHAATGLAVVTRDASVAGRLVNGANPAAVVYATPKAGDYVRVASAQDQIWVTGTWKAWPISAGDGYEVCTSDVAQETSISAATGNCTAWDVKLVPLDPRTFRLRWTHDAKSTLGAAITLTGFRLKYGTDASALIQVVDVNDGQAREYSLQLPKFATLYYVAITALQGAEESVKSNTISSNTGADPSIPLPPSVPTPPVLTFATTATTAYSLAQAANKITLAAVGTVPMGLPCTRLVVPGGALDVLKDRTKAVIAAGKTRPSAVVVKCG